MPADKRIKIRRGTAAEWATAETSAAQLAAGEVAWVDNDLVKGDGTTKVASLPRAGTGTYAPRVTVNDGGLFVSVNGSDSNDGLGPGSAKLTLAAAVAALPAAGGKVTVGVGTFNEVPIPLKTGVVIEGRGEGTRVQPAGTGDLFTVSTTTRNVSLSNMLLWGTATGGHVINGTSNFSESQFTGLHCVQINGAKSILQASVLIDVQWNGFVFEGTTGRSVPLVNLVSTDGSMSHNRFSGGRITPGNGAYGVHIEEQMSGTYAYNNTFESINFEVPDDGCIKALSAACLTVQDVATNDMGTSTQHLFVVGKSATNAVGSRAATFINTMRHGGTLGSALCDIDLANCASTVVMNCNSSLFTGYKIDWHGQYGFYVGLAADHQNGSAISIMGRYGVLVSGANITANRPDAATYPAGGMYYDTTLSKPIWSNGTVWKDAAGTTV